MKASAMRNMNEVTVLSFGLKFTLSTREIHLALRVAALELARGAQRVAAGQATEREAQNAALA